jgi:hypothetical protein
MRVTLSERKFSEQIRQLENIGPEVTTEELIHRIDRHARRLFDHIREFGVQMLQAGLQVSGTLCTMSASLKPAWDEESVQMRINGLAMLAPVSVSLDQPDLPAFVVNPVMLAAMQDNWIAFGSSLQRLTLQEVRPALENAAQQLMSAPVAEPTNDFERELQSLEYEAFLAAAGKTDPLKQQNAIDEYRQREEAVYAAAQQAGVDQKWNAQD